MSVSIDLVKRFCPVVFFHEHERFFPCSIEHLVRNSTLKIDAVQNGQGGEQPPVSIPDLDTLIRTISNTNPNITYYYAIDINPSQFSGQPVGQAPMYYAVQEFEDCIEITFVMLYAFQGGQTIRALRVGTEFYCI